MVMSAGDDLQSDEAIRSCGQVAESAEVDPETASWIARRVRMRTNLDVTLAVLVVVFAFVLASVPIRNSNVWLHLAAGRQLVSGPSSAGADPFLHTADETAGTHATWLFDVLCYGVYWTSGSLGLGVLKALAVALLAAAILRAGWTNAGWVPAACTTLAMTAIAPWLHMQPILGSLLFLALALGYLERRTAPVAAGNVNAPDNSWLSFWPMYLLIIFWVNIDPWFLLGPFVLTCYWLGGLVAVGQLRRPRVSALTVLAGILVCCASPRLHHAFLAPDELTLPAYFPWLADDGLFRPLFVSPLGLEFYETGQGRGMAGAAMGLLIALAFLGLVLNGVGRHMPRLMVCAGLLALSVYQARNIPFFVVALAALTPRALHEFAKARFRERPGFELRLRQAVTGRMATAILGVALIALAWLGVLQAGRPELRALGVEADPSLVRAGEQMAAWRREGKIGAGSLGFNYSPEVANYFAWYCPEEKGFFDSRFDVCTGATPDFALVRQGLGGTAFTPASPPDPVAPRTGEWREVLRRRGVDHIILADRDRERTQAVLRYVLAAPDEWQVLFQSGRVLVLGWRDRASKGAKMAAWRGLDLDRDGLHPDELEKAPAAPPDRPPDPSWWEHFVPRAERPSLDRDDATLRMMMFEALRLPTGRRAAREWELALATAAAGQAVAGDLTGAVLRIEWLPAGRTTAPGLSGLTAASPVSQRLLATYLAQRDEAPPGQLWAAVRACRRALAADGQDAEAYLLLGQLYCRLAWNTSERTWGQRLPVLGQVRKQQALGALQHAARIRPELDQAHGLLVTLYQEVGFVDIGLRHLQEFQKIHRARAATDSESIDRLERIAKDVEQLEREVFSRENVYDRKQTGLTLANRARLAQSLGLVDKALEILLGTDVTAFGSEELQVALELLLWTGRADEARDMLKPQHQDLLGEFDFHWLGTRLALAAGDYAGAEEHLGKLIVRSTIVPELRSRADLEIALSIVAARSVLAGLQRAVTPQTLLALGEIEPHARIQMLANTFERTAEFSILAGAVSLERGDPARAERYLRQALQLTQHHPRSSLTLEAGRSARPIADYYLHLLKGSAPESRSGAGGG